MSVSVIIPTCRRESLRRSVAYAIAQDYVGDLEIIIEDTPIHDDCTVISKARNAAVAKSKNEWLAFLDDDDWWYPNYLSLGTAMDADIVVSNSMFVGADIGDIPYIVKQGESVSGASGIMMHWYAFDELGGFDEMLPHSECWDILYRAAHAGMTIAYQPIKALEFGRGSKRHASHFFSYTKIAVDKIKWMREYENHAA